MLHSNFGITKFHDLNVLPKNINKKNYKNNLNNINFSNDNDNHCKLINLIENGA